MKMSVNEVNPTFPLFGLQKIHHEIQVNFAKVKEKSAKKAPKECYRVFSLGLGATN